ncbi:MAG: hydrogenase maturation nickel metallochaperone HypA [Azospirillaceae bacterium]|nr:hydrogenase maturation nickel metallochaperone HypA [Azospirillaceae bacterium]
MTDGDTARFTPHGVAGLRPGREIEMHEATIIESLMSILVRQARTHGVDHIQRVRLKVGALKAVEPQALRGCFEIFAEGTVAEGAELAIETVAARVLCRTCGVESLIQRFRFRCSQCDGDDLSVVGGEELYIESIEV